VEKSDDNREKVKTNVQIAIEQQRVRYSTLRKPLLAQMAEAHRLTVREFAAIFGISKSYAQEILNHEKFPSLEMAIRVARYWECTVEELFGWRVDDDGMRRPMMIELPGTGTTVRLSSTYDQDKSIPVTVLLGQAIRKEAPEMEE
jgi:transcriptional regulator with XRE-family HTH domain